MLTDDNILEIQNIINKSSSNEELFTSLKSYFIQPKTFKSDGHPLYIAWTVYQNIIQNNCIV
jgi:hypothetical protein